jgi:vitamin B12 transporter
LALVLCLSCPILAKSIPTYELPTTNVTAQRRAVPLNKTSSEVHILNNHHMEKSGVRDVKSALAILPGVSLADSAGITGIFLRGLSSNHVNLMYDGIRLQDVSTPQGTPIFSGVLLAPVERIEVVSGSQSPFYGSASLSGVIDIVPKQNDSEFSTAIGDRTFRSAIRHLVQLGHTSLNFGYALQRRSDLSSLENTTEKDSSTISNYRFGITQELGFAQVKATYFRSESNSQLDGTYDPGKTLAELDDPNYSGYFLQELSKASVVIPSGKDTTHTLSYKISSIARSTTNEPNAANLTDTLQSVYESRIDEITYDYATKISPFWRLILGINYTQEAIKSTDLSTDQYGNYDYSIPFTSQYRYGFFTQHEFTYDTGGLTIGARSEDFSPATTGEFSTTYSFGVFQWLPVLDATVRTNIGTGFRTPVLNEIRRSTGTLSPERSFTKDLALEKQFGPLTIGILAFDSAFEKKIDFVQTAPSVYHYVNLAGVSRSDGLVYSGTLRNWGIFDALIVAYTSQNSVKSDGTAFLRIPKASLTASAITHVDRIDFGLTWLWVGERPDAYYNSGTFGTERVTLASYSLASFQTGVHWNEAFSTRVIIGNLFNSVYTETTGYQTAGRRLEVECQYHF